ncbi:MAG: dTDP-4-dehydrorhamnose 3,5-epimerase [Bacteroidetes bacterium]|nr:dTDP-4-dehydrorhamnose 3,5-epimerase [Bacteroidota bacterium]MCL5737549.1 dTDP-4-dehydrorhamnose 3,5-epimerase [Bacteroidota bacterium]
MSFNFTRIKNPEGLIIVEPYTFGDERGFFMETYRADEFEKGGIKDEFVQDNQSRSVKGVIRGLHFQIDPHEQSKLVRCIKGEMFDVAVDLRKKSSTFGKWYGIVLSEENKKMLYIPKGFAHGFSTLSEVAEVIYKVDELYSREDERGIIFNDPQLAINWKVDKPVVSTKDRALPKFDKSEDYF